MSAANLAVGVGFGLLGLAGGLGVGGLGLSPSRLRAGACYGLAVLGVIAAGLAAAAAMPATRGFLADPRVHVSAGQMLLTVLVTIPLGTVVLEELAFRGTLLGLLRTQMSTTWAVAVCSVAFGLWHVSGVWSRGAGVIVGTVAATTVAGVGFAWLRLRSDSLLAPALAHVATNSVAFAAAWVVWRR